MTKNRKPITKRLKLLRVEHNMTQQIVATKAGMSIVRYNEIELGKRAPDADELAAIARVLKSQPTDILPAAEPVHANG